MLEAAARLLGLMDQFNWWPQNTESDQIHTGKGQKPENVMSTENFDFPKV